jgi:hypothetical protein
MKEQYIKLLKNQIDKLNSRDFDLDAWKDSTIIVLDRIFGSGSEKINKINSIHYDLSSWSLRDTLGTSAHFDTCKKKGKEILEVCIMELETIGVPEPTNSRQDKHNENVLSALEDELTISRFKELEKILSETNIETKEKLIYDFLGKIGSESSMKILSKILTSMGNA